MEEDIVQVITMNMGYVALNHHYVDILFTHVIH